jgi:uncharacterized caspase-like protein
MAMPIKQALVIGNDAYLSHPLGACINDAREVSNSLRSIGFQVHAQVDADPSSQVRLFFSISLVMAVNMTDTTF